MHPVLIGSRSIPDIVHRYDSVDFDFICTKAQFKFMVEQMFEQDYALLELKYVENKAVAKFRDNKNGKLFALDCSIVDSHGQMAESDTEVFEHVNDQYTKRNGVKCISRFSMKMLYASPAVNLMLKMSHRFKKNSPHFEKTRKDILALRKFVIDNSETDNHLVEYKSLAGMLKRREECTYNYKHPNLKQGKNAFFTDSVNYVYDHDTIHEAVKMLDKPAYTYYIADGAEVHCSKEKFEALPKIVKLYGVLEESYVLALERAIIPFDTAPERAFQIALEKVCTSITSGWFREFAWENYDTVKELYHQSFVQKFKSALEAGRIKPFSAEVYKE